jgi:hypothetical protein
LRGSIKRRQFPRSLLARHSFPSLVRLSRQSRQGTHSSSTSRPRRYKLMDGSHAQCIAGHDADIVDQLRAETATAFLARALPGALDVCPYCLDEPSDHRHANIQKRRSASSKRGSGLRRCRTTSCCRRQRLSATSNTFGRIAAAITHSKQRSIHPPSPLSDTEVAQCRQSGNLPG